MDGFHNLTLTTSPIPKLKATEVLVKIHAVSLQVCLPPPYVPLPLPIHPSPAGNMLQII